MYILTRPFDLTNPISYYIVIFRRLGDVFRWLLHFIFWMSVIFLLPVCLTYWPRKLESIPHAPTRTLIIPTKFEVDTNIHCRVTTFLSADTSRDLVTLSFDLLTLNSCRTCRVTWPTLPPTLNTPRLFVHELRIITVPIDYHRKCVRGHCACAESRDPWIFVIPAPDLPVHCTTFISLRRRLLSSVTNAKALDCVNFLCVTLWPWPLTFWPWTVVVHGESRDKPRHQVWRP